VLGSRPDVARTCADAGVPAGGPEDAAMRASTADVGAEGGRSGPPASAPRVPGPGSHETVATSSSTVTSTSDADPAALPRSAAPDGALSVLAAEHVRGHVSELVADEALADTVRAEDLAAKEP
jgi:hypothetical protein